MHDIFKQVLINKELTKVGDLFMVSDHVVMKDLSEIINGICKIVCSFEYVNNSKDQSVVEICITRITSAIRDTGSMDQHADTLVKLLKLCLYYNHAPSRIGEFPPHAKVSSEIISCLFLVSNYSKNEVMKIVLPISVQFLHKDNGILARNMVSYLSLAAIYNFPLLSKHVQTILISIISGNYTLCQILLQIYNSTRDYINDYTLIFISLLPLCGPTEKLTLLQLFSLIANHKPSVFKVGMSQLCEHLNTKETNIATLKVLLIIAKTHPQFVFDYVPHIRKLRDYHPKRLCITAQILSALGKLNQSYAQEALNFIFAHSLKMDKKSQNLMVREAISLYSSYPGLFTEEMLVKAEHDSEINSRGYQSTHGINIINTVQIDNEINSRDSVNVFKRAVIPQRRRLMSHYRGTGGLQPSNIHRGMTGTYATYDNKFEGFDNNMTKLSSNPMHTNNMSNDNSSTTKTKSFGVSLSRLINYPHGAYFKYSVAAKKISKTSSFTSRVRKSFSRPLKSIGKVLYQSLTCQRSIHSRSSDYDFDSAEYDSDDYLPVTVTRSYNKRILEPYIVYKNTGVFEPHNMRDTIQRFCNKHLISIKAYMEQIAVRLPPPIKYTIEERKSKRSIKLSFGCEDQEEHCLHDNNLFTIHTQYPHIWIHFIFLDIQASSTTTAFRSNDPLISDLKDCWDALKYGTQSFTTLTTSAFPSEKDQKKVLNELRYFGYFDLFDHCVLNKTGRRWCCVLCNRPEQIPKLIQSSEPIIEGELAGKHGHWKSLKKWKTQYFTLYTSHLSYKSSVNGEEKTLISINQIFNLKVIRDKEFIPKAFEINTILGTFTLKLDDKEKIIKWTKYMSIIVAYSRSQINSDLI